MSEPQRPVREVVYLTDIDDEMPTAGSNVIAIGLGGKLCETVWTRDSHLFFKAWMYYPKIPKKVKIKLSKNFPTGIPEIDERSVNECLQG